MLQVVWVFKRSLIYGSYIQSDPTNQKVPETVELYLLFPDLTKACDTVPIQKLWQVMERSKIRNKLITTIIVIYVTDRI